MRPLASGCASPTTMLSSPGAGLTPPADLPATTGLLQRSAGGREGDQGTASRPIRRTFRFTHDLRAPGAALAFVPRCLTTSTSMDLAWLAAMGDVHALSRHRRARLARRTARPLRSRGARRRRACEPRGHMSAQAQADRGRAAARGDQPRVGPREVDPARATRRRCTSGGRGGRSRPAARCCSPRWSTIRPSQPERFPTEADQEVERQRLFAIIEELVKWERRRIEDGARGSTGGDRGVVPAIPPPVLDPFAAAARSRSRRSGSVSRRTRATSTRSRC